MKKKMFALALATTVLGASLFAASQASAQGLPDQAGPMAGLVEKIATKFGLNQAEVQAVFDEQHESMMARHQEQYDQRLQQLVDDGKITKEQKQLIIAKNAELQAKHQSDFETFKDMEPQERHEAMKAERSELEAWAQQNGIDEQYLMFRLHFKGAGPVGGGEQVFIHTDGPVNE